MTEHSGCKAVASPCVGLCSTTYGDTVCRGCMRTSTEIAAWPASDETQKRAITLRLDGIMQQVMPEFFRIENQQALEEALHSMAVPFDDQRSVYAWLHKLLIRHVNTIKNPAAVGVALQQDAGMFDSLQQCRSKMYALARKGKS